MRKDYCNDYAVYKRQETWEVIVGGIPIGNMHPIRIQTMTNTDPDNVEATINQIINIANKGADYVRLTIPNIKAIENLKEIKDHLRTNNISIPLIADIHFNPDLAVRAASIADKVRINPGNFGPHVKYSGDLSGNDSHSEAFAKLREQFSELLEGCKKHSASLRIGTNHGSLSDRILSKYGDTPEGMAESAMEFLRICEEEKFRDVIVSMKASNTRVMVYATRLLVSKMKNEDMYFPVHLGVTEAGEGEDGRIRSAVGIGSLLSDGIGDTIRVSLTEDPELEIPVARKMVDYVSSKSDHQKIRAFGEYMIEPYDNNKLPSKESGNIGGRNKPVVLHVLHGEINIEILKKAGFYYSDKSGWSFTEMTPDYLLTENWPESIPVPVEKTIVLPLKAQSIEKMENFNSFMNLDEYNKRGKTLKGLKFIKVNASDIDSTVIDELKSAENSIMLLGSSNKNSLADMRSAVFRLMNRHCKVPVVFNVKYNETSKEDFQLKSAIDLGGLFIDGLGDGIFLENNGNISDEDILSTSFGILQASRVRISKAEYISCPSCGRTLFDLQDTTQKIREKTAHLTGLRIGIMGCIVNGPGEMADADYGYVGGARGKITLYKEKEVIKKNVPEENAVSELIELIKENGDWVDP